MFFYTVKCSFNSPDRESICQNWLSWLTGGHIQDVMRGGALGADVVQMETSADALVFEIRYRFPDEAAFQRYEKEFAPELRKDGATKFPHELGLVYERTTGKLIESVNSLD